MTYSESYTAEALLNFLKQAGIEGLINPATVRAVDVDSGRKTREHAPVDQGFDASQQAQYNEDRRDR